MTDEFDSELFTKLCNDASSEQDSKKLLDLTRKIKEMLEEKFDMRTDAGSKKKSA